MEINNNSTNDEEDAVSAKNDDNEDSSNKGTCPSTTRTTNKKKQRIRVALLHSKSHTQVLHETMGFIHQDRDLLLAALLDYCGFVRQTPKFLTVVSPKKASRHHLEAFHDKDYLDLLEYSNKNAPLMIPHEILESVGLTDDCPVPTTARGRGALWTYCRHVAGASLQAAHLLSTTTAASNVAIHWGGGRHHGHADQAGGFCYINDVVLAIQYLQQTQQQRILYLDIDIHHADGVQQAFYETAQVLTVSFHRHAPGFFPCDSGSIHQKGRHNTSGVGYNLNLPMPKCCTDGDFIALYQAALERLEHAYCPDAIVLCVGADGLRGDPVVSSTDQGWNLTPEGLAECVRITSQSCADSGNKLLLLGGGGYNPVQTARTFLLCTAAACEGARPGMLWNELPKDVPRHEFFERYGPEFELVGERPPALLTSTRDKSSMQDDYAKTLCEAQEAINVTAIYIETERNKENQEFQCQAEGDALLLPPPKPCNGGVKKGGRRRRKPKAAAGAPEQETIKGDS